MATRSARKAKPPVKPVGKTNKAASVPGAAQAAAQCARLFDEALVRHQAGDTDAAEALYARILDINPEHADALHLSGMAAYSRGQHALALQRIERAVALQPRASMYLGNLGNVLRASGRIDEAIATYRQAIAADPGNPLPPCNLGNALVDKGLTTEALAQYDKALALRPDFYEALFNQALGLRAMNRLDEAEAALRRAIAAHPNNPEAHYTLAQMLLLQGKLGEGWREYDWRWKLGEYAWLRQIHGEFAQPRWQGEDLAGKTLLVYAEQGMGDALQFMRYLPALVARAGKVIFAVHPRLRRLLGAPPGVTLTTLDTVPLPPFDVHSPLLSVPQYLGTVRIVDIPSTTPYLTAESARVNLWRQRLAARPGFRVGIAWQGNPNAKIDKGRSPPLASFAPLARLPGVRLISLQGIDGLEQLQSLPPGMVVEQLDGAVDKDGAFVDTAAIMACLDLIVVSDSAIAHLAGALGCPVWVPLKWVPDWRFLLERDDMPWYPTMRLFRQRSDGDWADVFGRVAAALAERLPNTAPAAATPRLPMADNSLPLVPQSWGEMIDKITILEIKSERLTDDGKLANVRRELAALEAVREGHFPAHAPLAVLAAKLRAVNESLWWIEDEIRGCERVGDFGEKFIELARAVYVTNDQRAAVKREINDALGSALVEEKSYAAYTDAPVGEASAALVARVRESATAGEGVTHTAVTGASAAAAPAAPVHAPAANTPATTAPKELAAVKQVGVITACAQGLFASDLEDQFVGRALRERGSYGAEEIALATRLLRPGDKVLVLGAHIGTVVIGLARRCAQLTAFEANPATYRYFLSNLAFNDIANVTSHNLAASDKAERLRFVLSRHNSGGSKRYPAHAEAMYFYDQPAVVEVDAVAMDAFLPDAEFALVFMDIEGSEFFALRGMPRILGRCRALSVEFIPHHLKNVAAVTPEAFAELIVPHFDVLFVPTLNAVVEKANFSALLRRMYDLGMAQEQIVFMKHTAFADFQATARS